MTDPASPERLAVVAACLDHSIADLTRLRSPDPAAREAMRCVKLTMHTLQSFWIPTLDLLGRPDLPGPAAGSDAQPI